MTATLDLLPTDLAVLCPGCGCAVLLVTFLNARGAKRQVVCPQCEDDVVIRDAW
jgi:hypothetical protein